MKFEAETDRCEIVSTYTPTMMDILLYGLEDQYHEAATAWIVEYLGEDPKRGLTLEEYHELWQMLKDEVDG